MDLFYAATKITLGNGRKTPFWEAPWLDGRSPKVIAPLIFESSMRKNWKVAQALANDAWVNKINLEAAFSWAHLVQFVDLWTLINNIHLVENVEDSIVWKLTESGLYSAASAYKLQFLGIVLSNLNTLVWKAWATPKAKNHAWLALQNRLWTADRLQNRGWPNCGLCPLCKQTLETNDHLFVGYRFIIRVWELLKQWLGLHDIHPRLWGGLNIKEWWSLLAEGSSSHRKAIASLTLLTVWEVWNERNARIFHNKLSPSLVIVDRIKAEARLWVLAGAKKLGTIMPGE
jgi:hypothetical protein